MNILIVLAHPERQSFNGAMCDAAAEALRGAGHSVVVSDLYRMGFDPRSDRRNFRTVKDPEYLKLQVEESWASEQNGFAPDLEAEIAKIEACDLMIFQFPLWWFGMPALLKGWVDRVFAMGRVYGHGQVYADGRFRGKRAMLSVTTGGPSEAYAPGGFNGAIGGILRPIQRGMLQFVGFQVLAPHVLYGPARVEPAVRAQWLADWQRRLRDIAREAPVEVGTY